jgi:preprotein translocase subunit SecG
MSTILLTIHLLVALAMIVMVLLQRSEGGALGIGGSGGMMSGRALGNTLTRLTAIFATIFFITSIGLTILGSVEKNSSVLDGVIQRDENSGELAPPPVLPEPELPTPSK